MNALKRAISVLGLTVIALSAPQIANAAVPNSATVRSASASSTFSLDALEVGNPRSSNTDVTGSYYPGGMNSAEFWFCANPLNVNACAKAKAAADDALARAQARFASSTLYLGKGDAYRHCYWSARMTIDMGAATAKGFGDRHEADSSGADKDMDLRNNATGRSVGGSYRTYTTSSNRCEYLARNGHLVTLR